MKQLHIYSCLVLLIAFLCSCSGGKPPGAKETSMGQVAPDPSLGGEERKQEAERMCEGLKIHGHDYTRIEGTQNGGLTYNCFSGEYPEGTVSQ